MTKFEKVRNALMKKTENTGNWITVTQRRDARHKYKYVIVNVVTNNLTPFSYRTLKEIIKEYDLNIENVKEN